MVFFFIFHPENVELVDFQLFCFDEDVDEISTAESLQYPFDTIKTATNDFSNDNKLGEGGFGSVYKVIFLQDSEFW